MDSAAANRNSLFVKFFTLPDRKRRLRLPRAWTLYMGQRLPLSAYLRNRYGDKWVVKITYDNITKRYSFEEGWKKFVEYNKVEFKDHFVFKYNGISTFDFKLFDKNNEEKGYVRPASIKREEEELQSEETEQDTQLNFDDELTDEELRPKKREMEKRAPAINHADEDAIFRKARIPRPENPYFVTKRRSNRNVMYVPKDVINDCMLEFPEEVKIWDEKGRNWKAFVQKWKDGRLWLSKGWSSYCRRNNVGLDDWCIIEIVKPKTPGANIYLKARRVPAASVRRP